MNPIGGPLLYVILTALGLSVLGNAALGWVALSAHDTATVAVVHEQAATGAAIACGQGTTALVTKADDNKAKGAVKVAEAKKQADAHDKRADVILAAPPAAPGDACKSAEAIVDTWWEARKP